MGMKKSERSRVHAKQRRQLEAKEIADITRQLPLADRLKCKLDKAAILRLAVTFMRLKHCVGEDKNAKWAAGMLGNEKEAKLLLETLGGFFIMLSTNMEVLYVSENIEKHLGIKQVDMISSSFLDYVYAKDQAEVLKQLELKPLKSEGVVHGLGLADVASGSPVEMDIAYDSCQAGSMQPQYESRRRFFIHMKCIYSQKNAFSQTSANSEFMLLQCVGYLHLNSSLAPNFLVAVCRPLQPTPIMELRVDGNMFLSRHSLDMRFMYCDPRLSTIFGYEPDEVIGQSMYNYHHPGDLVTCSDCHSNLMTTGASISKYYRFLGKSNEWFWLQTRATVVYNASKYPQYIVCMNYIVSEKEGKRHLEDRLKQSGNRKQDTLPRAATSRAPDSVGGSSVNRDTAGCAAVRTVTDSQSTVVSGVSRTGSSELAWQSTQSTSSPFIVSNDATVDRDYSVMSLASNVSDLALCNVDLLDDETERIGTSATPAIGSQQPVQLPQFYIDTQAEPFVEEPLKSACTKSSTSDSTMDHASSADEPLGNLWLSVHAIVDPMATPIHASEVYPTEFAEELEDMSYAHCSRLMRDSTEAALRAYSVEGASQGSPDAAHSGRGTPGAAVSAESDEWAACVATLDRQANRLYEALHVNGFKPNRRTQSSASLAAMSEAISESGRPSAVASSSSSPSRRSGRGGSQRSDGTATPALAALHPSPAVVASGATHPSMQSLATSEDFLASCPRPDDSASTSPGGVLVSAGGSSADMAQSVNDERPMEGAMERLSPQAGAGGALSPEEMCAIDEMLCDYPDFLAATLSPPSPALWDSVVDLPPPLDIFGLSPSFDFVMDSSPSEPGAQPRSASAQVPHPHGMIVDDPPMLPPSTSPVSAYYQPGLSGDPPLLHRPSILEQLLLGGRGSQTESSGRGSSAEAAASGAGDAERGQPPLVSSGPPFVAAAPSSTAAIGGDLEVPLPWSPMSGVQLYNPDEDELEFVPWCGEDSKLP